MGEENTHKEDQHQRDAWQQNLPRHSGPAMKIQVVDVEVRPRLVSPKQKNSIPLYERLSKFQKSAVFPIFDVLIFEP